MTRESSCKVYGQLIWSLVWNWFSLHLSLSSSLLSVFNQSNWRENSIQQNLNKPELKSAAGKMETIDRKQKSFVKIYQFKYTVKLTIGFLLQGTRQNDEIEGSFKTSTHGFLVQSHRLLSRLQGYRAVMMECR